MNISGEGLDQDLTYVFIVKFDNKDDLEYYVNNDTEYAKFKFAVGPVLIKGKRDNGVLVFDFEYNEHE
ncbi:hypothetical protein BC936DRAFT_149599 [Jimgerdemannia flammicorona]|uniref:Stress-response A/B barrel domain-containing protein n=1 Tax=Jimgerdemannia flammicorona TaxID=994334 RepID=A0A433D0I1_9FUNG|nr:hypothetical protein BC936DRAFT_149599 [Jimgerdemannia flammicorona]